MARAMFWAATAPASTKRRGSRQGSTTTAITTGASPIPGPEKATLPRRARAILSPISPSRLFSSSSRTTMKVEGWELA